MGETLRQRDVAGSPHSSIRKAGSFFVSARHAARENDERGGDGDASRIANEPKKK